MVRVGVGFGWGIVWSWVIYVRIKFSYSSSMSLGFLGILDGLGFLNYGVLICWNIVLNEFDRINVIF